MKHDPHDERYEMGERESSGNFLFCGLPIVLAAAFLGFFLLLVLVYH